MMHRELAGIDVGGKKEKKNERIVNYCCCCLLTYTHTHTIITHTHTHTHTQTMAMFIQVKTSLKKSIDRTEVPFLLAAATTITITTTCESLDSLKLKHNND